MIPLKLQDVKYSRVFVYNYLPGTLQGKTKHSDQVSEQTGGEGSKVSTSVARMKIQSFGGGKTDHSYPSLMNLLHSFLGTEEEASCISPARGKQIASSAAGSETK